MHSTFQTDRVAVAISTACVAHCVALPVLSLALPFAGTLAEFELVHWVLAACAIFASLSIFIRAANAREPHFLVPAGAGVSLITFGLFTEQFGIGETLPTLFGGLLLAAAHLGRIKRHHTDGRDSI